MRIIQILLYAKFDSDNKVCLKRLQMRLDEAKDYMIGVVQGYETDDGNIVLRMKNDEMLGKQNTTLNEYISEFNEDGKILGEGKCREFIVLHEPSSPQYIQGVDHKKMVNCGPSEIVEKMKVLFQRTGEENVLEAIPFRISNEQLLREVGRMFNIGESQISGIVMDNDDVISWKSGSSFLEYLLNVEDKSKFGDCTITAKVLLRRTKKSIRKIMNYLDRMLDLDDDDEEDD